MDELQTVRANRILEYLMKGQWKNESNNHNSNNMHNAY